MGSGSPGLIKLIGSETITVKSTALFISANVTESAGSTLTVSTSTATNRLEFDRAETLDGGLAVLGRLDHVANNLTVGGTLSGTGTILGSDITFSNGSAAPGTTLGNDIGTLHTTNLVFSPGSSYTPQLESTGDSLDVTGTVTLTGSSLCPDPLSPGARADRPTLLCRVEVEGGGRLFSPAGQPAET